MNLLVQTPDEILKSRQKPAFRIVKNLVLGPDDCLLICAGFEDRSIAALESALGSSESFNVVVVKYEPEISANRLGAVKEKCSSRRISFREVLYNRQQPSGIGRAVIDELTECRGRIVMDVSGMSRLLIVQLLVALASRQNSLNQCTVLYTEAEHYPPREMEARRMLELSADDPTYSLLCVSSDIFEISIVPELSSVAIAGSQTRLISFPSLDPQHLTALTVELQPSRYSFIEGVPPSQANAWRTDLIAEMNRLADFRDAERFYVGTLDYSSTLHQLLEIYRQHSIRDRLLVAPTGSKLQSVAVGLFRSFISDVQIVYPTPRGFKSPQDYTRGAGTMHILELDSLSPTNVDDA